MKSFKFYRQPDSMDCGPTCLKMVARHYGKDYAITFLREKCYIDRAGVSLLGITEAAELIGFKTIAVKLPAFGKKNDAVLSEAPFPAILHWNQNHFVVLYKLSQKYAWIADPADGLHKLPIPEFNKSWITEDDKGIALLLEPGEKFYNSDEINSGNPGIRFLMSYLRPHRKLFLQLFLGLILGTVLQLIIPFLTQSLVDVGIDTRDLNFIYLVLIGQLCIFLGATSVRFIQSWILLHISVRINVSLVSDFLTKLMNLPLSFFDSKNTGDLLQRIGDHKRIESFLTNSSLSLLLAITNLLIFGTVLLIYDLSIFLVFLVSAILYISWVFIFLKMRKEVDYLSFRQMSDNQDALIEMIQGMPEIKLQGSQFKRRNIWTGIQAKLFRIQMKTLAIGQYQDAGALSINQLKDIFITFLSATLVLDGKITLGMMLAIQYIIGQLNGPLQQLIGFIRSAQDAKISLDRLSEVHHEVEEEELDDIKISEITDEDIHIENLSFKYTPISNEVLSKVSFTIPKEKTTAIVGSSGSGKTTLIKLLLGFYKPSTGRIKVGSFDLQSIKKQRWREKCGVVLQDGFVFSDTIGNNIAESDVMSDLSKVLNAAEQANILDFIEDLPLQFKTKIGSKGNGLSQGQKQRLFIARAIYKNPSYLFFDEATNALDATNEKIIMENLQRFLKNKTAIIVAHRLSTVKNADNIIVLDHGIVVEQGNHEALVKQKGYYYELVKNQLELGT